MTTEERIRRQKEMVEMTGRFFDKKGLQPSAGRIIGLLTVMDKEQFTFDEIVEELKISKSSASIALRFLELSNKIEYITLAGDRKRYFRIKKLDKFSLFDELKESIEGTRKYLQSALELKADKNSGNAVNLREYIHVIDFFSRKFEELKMEYLHLSK